MAEVKMVAKQTWIKAIRPIRLKNGDTVVENSVVEVDEQEAQEFCDKKLKTCFPFSGERSDKEWKEEFIVRAVRVDKPTEEAKA